MHVTEQIANAVVETLRTSIPALHSRVFIFGVAPTGRRAYPTAVVLAGESDIQTTLSGSARSGRPQQRTLQLGVAVRDLETEGADYAARLTDIAAAIEAALAGWDVLPIDDIALDGDSGVQDIDDGDEDGIHAGIALQFTIRFFTREGDSTAFLEPNR